MVATFLPHLLQGIAEFLARDFLRVLEFEEAVAAVAGEVNEDVGALVGEELLRARRFRGQSPRQQAHKVLHRDLVASVIDFDVVAVDVDVLDAIVEDGRWSRVSRIASHVVGYHEDDLGIGNSETFDAPVNGEDVGHVAIVEPETGRVHQYCPIVGVAIFGEILRDLEMRILFIYSFYNKYKA